MGGLGVKAAVSHHDGLVGREAQAAQDVANDHGLGLAVVALLAQRQIEEVADPVDVDAAVQQELPLEGGDGHLAAGGPQVPQQLAHAVEERPAVAPEVLIDGAVLLGDPHGLLGVHAVDLGERGREGRPHDAAHVPQCLVRPAVSVHDGACGADDAGHGVHERSVKVKDNEVLAGHVLAGEGHGESFLVGFYPRVTRAARPRRPSRPRGAPSLPRNIRVVSWRVTLRHPTKGECRARRALCLLPPRAGVRRGVCRPALRRL